jgi:hypothetical protein
MALEVCFVIYTLYIQLYIVFYPGSEVPEPEEEHSCATCPQVFARAEALRKHQRTHMGPSTGSAMGSSTGSGTGSSPGSSCHICGQTFLDRITLARHQVEVTPASYSAFPPSFFLLCSLFYSIAIVFSFSTFHPSCSFLFLIVLCHL